MAACSLIFHQRGAEIATDWPTEMAHMIVCIPLPLHQVQYSNWRHLQKIAPSWLFRPAEHGENAFFAIFPAKNGERRLRQTEPVNCIKQNSVLLSHRLEYIFNTDSVTKTSILPPHSDDISSTSAAFRLIFVKRGAEIVED